MAAAACWTDSARDFPALIAQSLGAVEHRIAQINLRIFSGSALPSEIKIPKKRTAAKMAPSSPMIHAAVLGGLGNLPGAILGGVLIAIIVNLMQVYVSSSYASGVTYVLMGIVLLIRVRGLLGDDLEAVRQV